MSEVADDGKTIHPLRFARPPVSVGQFASAVFRNVNTAPA